MTAPLIVPFCDGVYQITTHIGAGLATWAGQKWWRYNSDEEVEFPEAILTYQQTAPLDHNHLQVVGSPIDAATIHLLQ